VVDKVRLFWNHPGFIEPLAARVAETVASLESCVRDRARLLFSAHSIPMALASSGDYQAQLGDAAALVATRAGQADRQWELVFQSRSGPPSEPWLEPDIGDRLEALAAGGCPAVVVVPLGFVSDHMEVVYDLDIVARARAEASGLSMVRVPTVGDTPAFVAMVVELVRERVWPDRTPRRALGRRGPWPDTCPLGCCPPPAPTAPPS
jgi:ferrochelatase